MRVCVIPARGGSKRIPGKNIKLLGNKPLISYTIDAAIASKVFDEIYISSDDINIVEYAKSKNILIDERPQNLVGDTITQVQVINEFIKRKKLSIDTHIVSLLPTCPFRRSQDIINAYEIFRKDISAPLIGVVEYDFPIQLALSKKNKSNLMTPFFENGYEKTRSQDIEKTWHPNGAIYISTVEQFLKNNTFFSSNMNTYEMDAIHSFDIDYPWQFEVAQQLLKTLINE